LKRKSFDYASSFRELRIESSSDYPHKQRQIDAVSDMMRRNMRKSKGDFNNIIVFAISSAFQKAEQTDIVIKTWGSEESNPEGMNLNKELLERVRESESILGLIKYLGKYREILTNTRKNNFTFGRGDKYDITLGNDYSRAVSSEYAYLAVPETIPLFIRKVQRKALKQYRKRERISKGYGDIVICLDESSSMKGDPIAWAKAVALTLMESAIKNGRSCAVVRFASKCDHQTHIFKKGQYYTDDIMKFIESFLNGGTDFEWPLSQAAELIIKNGYENADIIFLTDGICAISDEYAALFKDISQQHNFTVTGIVMDAGEPGMTFSLESFCRKVYRLSELTRDEVAADIIRTLAA